MITDKKRTDYCTIDLSILQRERDRTVNVILRLFRTADHVMHERFRPSNVSDRFTVGQNFYICE